MRNMLMLFAALAATGFGQTKVPDMVAIVYTDVIPARTAENEAGLAKIRDAYKKAEYPFYLNLTRLFAGPQAVSISPVSDLASREQGVPLGKLMGEAEYQRFLGEYRQTHTGSHFLLVRTMPHLTIQDAPIGSLPVVVMQRTKVAFDRRAEFESRLRETIIPALKKAGVKRLVASRVMFGGASNEYVMVRSHAGLADAEKASEVIGRFPPAPGLVLSSDRMVYRINPALSFAEGIRTQ